MNKLIETFCDVDEFCQLFMVQWEQQLIEDYISSSHKPDRENNKVLVPA